MVAVSAYFSLLYIAEVSAKVKKYTFGEVAAVTLGSIWKYVAEGFFFVNNFGAAIGILVLIHQNMCSIVKVIDDQLFDVPSWMLDNKTLFWIGLTCAFLIPLILQKSLKELKFVSLLGLFTILYLATVIVVYAFTLDDDRISRNLNHIKYADPKGLAISFSEMLYSF